jgi:predicted RND superfamily exporter protein
MRTKYPTSMLTPDRLKKLRERDKVVSKEFMERIRKLDEAVAHIRKVYKDTGETQGAMKCPLCQGPLYWSLASYNKHTRGGCTTRGCLTWVE